MRPDPCADRKGGQSNLVKCDEETRQGVETIKGEVSRIDGNDLLVQRYNGKEVRFHIDQATRMTEFIGPDDRIEAKVDDQEHVLSIHQIK